MKPAALLAAVLFLSVTAHAEQDATDPQTSPDPATLQSQGGQQVPPLDVKLGNDDTEIGLRPTWNLGPGFTLTTAVRAGEIAVGSTLDDPYSVLLPSPFMALDLKGVYSGSLESMVTLTGAEMQLNSHTIFSDPGGTANSPANTTPTQTNYSQNTIALSAYGDLGKIVDISPAVRAAVFAAADAWSFQFNGTGEGQDMLEANAGAALMLHDDKNRFTVLGDVNGVPGRDDFTSNYTPWGTYLGGTERAEYEHRLGGSNWGMTGVETTQNTAQNGYRPYVGVENGDAKIMLAGNFQTSNYYAYPNQTGVGVDFRTDVAPGVSVTAAVAMNNDNFPGAPGPELDGSAQFGIRIDLDHKAVVESALEVQRYQNMNYQASDSNSLMARLSAANYTAQLRQILQESPTMADFVKNVNAQGTDQILATLSALSLSMGQHNYNYNESPSNMNSNNMETIYEAARSTYLNGGQDPVLVCMGEAEFTATLAEALGQQAGVPIKASGVTVAVPVNGSYAGHAVAFVQTPQYGYVLVDWGQLTPTNTYNIKTAAAIYQGLVGIPVVYNEITNPDNGGSHVGYMMSDDGKEMVQAATFYTETKRDDLSQTFQDDYQGQQVTTQRYLDLMKNKPSDE